MTRYSKASLDKEARLAAKNYRKAQNPETNYRASIAKVEFWEIIIPSDLRHDAICFQVHLDNGAIVNVTI